MSEPAIIEEGTPVMVLGNPNRHQTLLGLYGFVQTIYRAKQEGEQDSYWVTLLSNPAPDEKSEIDAEAFGQFRTTSASTSLTDLRVLEAPAKLKRVAAMKAVEDAKRAEPLDPGFEKLMKDILADERDAAKRLVRKQLEEAVKAADDAMGQVFKFPGMIKRGDKSDFPAYRDPAVQAVDAEVRGYACREESDWTVEERVRWAQGRALIEASSFWSPREECRKAVAEFDLDPMLDEFNAALYRNRAHVFCVNGELRKTVIRLWNRRALIVQVEDAMSIHMLWGPYCSAADKPPAGFIVTYAFRRTLPT